VPTAGAELFADPGHRGCDGVSAGGRLGISYPFDNSFQHVLKVIETHRYVCPIARMHAEPHFISTNFDVQRHSAPSGLLYPFNGGSSDRAIHNCGHEMVSRDLDPTPFK